MGAVDRGEKMKALRKSARLTQRQAGELVGVTASAVGQWESGSTTPEWNKLRALDEGYGAGGQLLALFNDDIGVSQLDEVLDQLERQALALEVVLRVLARLDALGVDVSELPAAATLMRRVAQ